MKKVLCFGDSNTWGYKSDTRERYPRNIRWTGILQRELTGMGMEVIEAGMCGRTTVFEDLDCPGRRGMDVFPELVKSLAPLWGMVLMLRTNDCKTEFYATAGQIGAGMEEIVRTAREISPETQILLVSPILLGDEVWTEGLDPSFDAESVEKAKQLKGIYQGIAKRYGTSFLAASDYAYPGPADREHLDADGHRKLAEAIRRKIKEMHP